MFRLKISKKKVVLSFALSSDSDASLDELWQNHSLRVKHCGFSTAGPKPPSPSNHTQPHHAAFWRRDRAPCQCSLHQEVRSSAVMQNLQLCSVFNAEKFIQCVQEYPSIWERSMKEYSDRAIKAKQWDCVGRKMYEHWDQMTDSEKRKQVKEMKNKWRHIRDSYLRYLNQWKSGHSACKRKKYIYAEMLYFLAPTVNKKNFSGNIQNEAGEGEHKGTQQREQTSAKEEKVVQQRHMYEPVMSVNRQPKVSQEDKLLPNKEVPQQGKECKPVISLKRQPDSNSFSKTTIPPRTGIRNGEEEDADRAFLLSLLPYVRKLSYDEKLDFRVHSIQFFRNQRMYKKSQSSLQHNN